MFRLQSRNGTAPAAIKHLSPRALLERTAFTRTVAVRLHHRDRSCCHIRMPLDG